MLEHLLERATDFSSSDWPRVVGTLRALVDAAQVQINAIARSHQEQDDSLTAVKAEYAEALMLLKAAQEPSDADPLDASYLMPAVDDEVAVGVGNAPRLDPLHLAARDQQALRELGRGHGDVDVLAQP